MLPVEEEPPRPPLLPAPLSLSIPTPRQPPNPNPWPLLPLLRRHFPSSYSSVQFVFFSALSFLNLKTVPWPDFEGGGVGTVVVFGPSSLREWKRGISLFVCVALVGTGRQPEPAASRPSSPATPACCAPSGRGAPSRASRPPPPVPRRRQPPGEHVSVLCVPPLLSPLRCAPRFELCRQGRRRKLRSSR